MRSVRHFQNVHAVISRFSHGGLRFLRVPAGVQRGFSAGVEVVRQRSASEASSTWKRHQRISKRGSEVSPRRIRGFSTTAKGFSAKIARLVRYSTRTTLGQFSTGIKIGCTHDVDISHEDPAQCLHEDPDKPSRDRTPLGPQVSPGHRFLREDRTFSTRIEGFSRGSEVSSRGWRTQRIRDVHVHQRFLRTRSQVGLHEDPSVLH